VLHQLPLGAALKHGQLERMHHIEQLRSLLDLVDHHDEGRSGRAR
jgi:hypothetical protein